MLVSEEISQIKEHLEKAQNPIFFFDNDQDGLCSFLLLQRYIGRGKGVAIKSFPYLDESYFRKVDELNADYIFILDKPLVSDGFFERVRERNIPVVWIDHHAMDLKAPDFVSYYNPCLNREECEPVSVLCYQISNNRKDNWLAVIGSIADCYLPDFYNEFLGDFPELGVKTDNPFEVLYNSRIGDVARILSNGLKDTTTNVVRMLKFLIDCKSPYDVLEEGPKNFHLHKRSAYIQAKYDRIFDRARNIALNSGKFVFFKYSGDLSVSGEIANHLKYLFSKKYICVVYIRGEKANISLRGKNIRGMLDRAIEGFGDASGGGHNDAVGGKLNLNDLDEFKKRIEEEVKNVS